VTVREAIAASPARMARGVATNGKELLAMRTGVGIRIVKSVTDCTVVRKLTAKEEFTWDDWKPEGVCA
jgi:hypothetical protein